MSRLLIHFARYGPYHHARLRSAHEALAPFGWEVIGLETAGTDETYEWAKIHANAEDPQVVTVFPGGVHEELTSLEYRRVFLPLLDDIRPDAMAIAGWGSRDAVMCLSWCRKNDARRIVMSETRAADGQRVWWKEMAKRYLISRFHGALVGGKSHHDYLVQLGMKSERIAHGYNVVDNDYFAKASSRSMCRLACPSFFLASNRFIERKNLMRLVEAYALYVQKAENIHLLCLLGDGEQKPALIARCRELGLDVMESAPWDVPFQSKMVCFPGFRQIEELPRFYAHACCFIHPALEEPWGLVINEAMACGLPVLSGDNVGAAESLVEDGVNGWKFDAMDVDALANLMFRVSAADFPSGDFAAASRRILLERAPTAAFGLGLRQLLANYPTSS